ncbi:adenylate cyclase [Sporanaerobium hydrogeniformans]|uniref:Adenylate cyclase n=1 Tax=Sporanaerobium hydrogeniformans TaxID=3072179 RepID=A0AC61DAI4_9FIRM|nr:CYTH domain-containing protein [Sporanaerobium hydrogeniformans]PHV70359.1 adenylate cyclase [Sporanaerobium hydrogeniformans]
MEIERKFLVDCLPDLTHYKHKKLTQGYISTDPVIRVRQMGDSYFLTVKSQGHMIREEFDLPITKEQYESLLCKLECPPIEKVRYYIPLENNLIAELDVFTGSLHGLTTVEVEFNSSAAAHNFEVPSWFGKDITHDNRYKNNHLAIYGLPL